REAAKPAEAKSEPKAEHHKGHGEHADKGDKGAKESGKGAKAAAPAAAAAAPPPVPVEKKPVKGSLDDLLEGALSHKPAAAAAKPRVTDDDSPRASAAASAGPLAKGAVVAGMNSVKGKVSDCYNQFKVPGMAMVNVVIGKNGHVSSATVSGKFAGTPTGSCVEKAVKSASFPPSDGFTTPYPFQLK
ncbi:MAG: Fe-S oxidoreductase, partial [Myxococcales bacterium]|nr:Fe-S oxidoreductase [Myxococcales bacterium]